MFRSFTGILEMNSFQGHFSNLYNATYEDSVNNQTTVDLESINDSLSGFCGSPDDASSKTCGSGDGAGAASLIVSGTL